MSAGTRSSACSSSGTCGAAESISNEGSGRGEVVGRWTLVAERVGMIIHEY